MVTRNPSFQNFINSREQKDATYPVASSQYQGFNNARRVPEDPEWLNSEEYRAVQKRVEAGEFSYAYQGNRARVQAFANAKKEFERKKKLQAEQENIRSVRVLNMQGEAYDPVKESPEAFLERDKNDYIVKNGIESFTSSPAEAEALYYQQLVDSNNSRARKEYGGAVIDRPVNLPSGDFNAQIDVYKNKILQSLRPSTAPGAGTRTTAQEIASREIKGGRNLAKTLGGFANPASQTFIPTLTGQVVLGGAGRLTGNETLENVLGTAGEFVGFGLAGGATAQLAKQDVVGLSRLGWKTLTGSKNQIQKIYGSRKARSAEQLQNAIQNAAGSPPSTRLSREELIQNGYTTPEQRLLYNRSQINPDPNQQTYQTTFINEAEDGTLSFTTGNRSIKVTGVDSFVDASADVLGLQEEIRETLRPVLTSLFEGMGRSMRISADDVARQAVREVYELPSGTKNKVAEFATDSNNVGIDLMQNLGGVIGYVKYGDTPAKQADGYISVLHEVGHAILPAVLRIAKEVTPANQRGFAQVLQERIIDRGTFTEAQKNIIYQTDLDKLLQAIRGAYEDRSLFNKLNELEQNGEDFGTQLNEAFTELFVKYMHDSSQGAQRGNAGDGISDIRTFLDEAAAFTRQALKTLVKENPNISGAALDAPKYDNFQTFRALLDAVVTGDTSKLTDPAVNRTVREIALYSDKDQTPLEVSSMVDYILGRGEINKGDLINTAIEQGFATTDVVVPFREFHVTSLFRQVALAKIGDEPIYTPHLELLNNKALQRDFSEIREPDNQMVADLRIAVESVLFDPKHKGSTLWELPPDIQQEIVLVNPLDANDVAASAFKDSRGRGAIFFQGGPADFSTFDHTKTRQFGNLNGVGLYCSDSVVAGTYLANQFTILSATNLDELAGKGRLRAFAIKVPEDKVLDTLSVGDSDPVATRYFKTLFSDKGFNKFLRDVPEFKGVQEVRTGDIEEVFSRDILKNIRLNLPKELAEAMLQIMSSRTEDFLPTDLYGMARQPEEFFAKYITNADEAEDFRNFEFYKDFSVSSDSEYDWSSWTLWSEAFQIASVRATKQALDNFGVVFFRNQKLDSETYIKFAKQFGPLAEYPMLKGLEGYPEITVVEKKPDEKIMFGEGWHTDSTYTKEPPRFTMLYSIKTPEKGKGNTLFASQYRSYETLDDNMKNKLKKLKAVFSADGPISRTRQNRVHEKGTGIDPKSLSAIHNIIKENERNHKKSLYLSPGHAIKICDIDEEESKKLMKELVEHQTKNEFIYGFEWEPNCLALWSNYSVLHNPVNDFNAHRVMHRITIQ